MSASEARRRSRAAAGHLSGGPAWQLSGSGGPCGHIWGCVDPAGHVSGAGSLPQRPPYTGGDTAGAELGLGRAPGAPLDG